MASLIVANGKNQGFYYPLGHRTTVIGRAESLLVQVLDEKVSRKHLQIRYDHPSKAYIATDMSSTHGVYVNGLKITDETVLNDEDHIQIGDTILLFTLLDFPDRESALNFFKKPGQRERPTVKD